MRSLFAAALLLLASFGALPASAQTVDWRTWERYMDNGRRALSQGREAGAENWFSDAAARRSASIRRARSSPPR